MLAKLKSILKLSIIILTKIIIVILIHKYINLTGALRPSHPRSPGCSHQESGAPTADSIKLSCSLLNIQHLHLWIRQILCFVKKSITLKSDLILLNAFLNQTYILGVFNDETSKVILFWKINRYLHSTTQGSIHRDLTKNKL